MVPISLPYMHEALRELLSSRSEPEQSERRHHRWHVPVVTRTDKKPGRIGISKNLLPLRAMILILATVGPIFTVDDYRNLGGNSSCARVYW